MTLKFSHLLAVALLPLAVTSCKDDPELVRKREEQKTEIKRLQSEIALLDEKLKDTPPDRTRELEAARKQVSDQETELAGLEKDVLDLESRKRQLEAEYSSYKAKYLLNSN